MAKKRGYPPGTIAVASAFEARYTDFSVSLVNSMMPGTTLHWFRGASVAENFNRAIRAMRGEWVWLLGDDHVWEPPTLQRLLQADVDIVVPIVLKRDYPFQPVVYDTDYNAEADGYRNIAIDKIPIDGKLVEVNAAGSAGMLIRRRVFQKMADPWFEFGQRGSTSLNEDTYFCEKAREAGFKVHLDTGAAMGHITPVTIWPRASEQGLMVGFEIGHRFELAWDPRTLRETSDSPPTVS